MVRELDSHSLFLGNLRLREWDRVGRPQWGSRYGQCQGECRQPVSLWREGTRSRDSQCPRQPGNLSSRQWERIRLKRLEWDSFHRPEGYPQANFR